MRTLAIVNQKGGSGKTTTAINIAAIYAARGLRTLLVDMDPQSHCAAGLGVPDDRIEYGIADALLDQSKRGPDPDDLVWEVTRNLDLAPSTLRLAGLEAPGGGLHELEDKDRRLLNVLRSLADRYDRCVIDCPPTIGILTYNAMRASREALIPVETGFLAMKGAKRQWQTIKHLVDRIDRSIAVHVLATIHDAESRASCDVLDALRRDFAGQIVPIVIHRHEQLREAVSFGQPIIEFAPDSKARLDYERLVEWLEDHLPTPKREQPDSAAVRPLPNVGPLSDERLPPLPSTARVMTQADHAAPPSSRAAEMVQRVQGLARRAADEGKRLDELVEDAIRKQDDRPGIVVNPIKVPVDSPTTDEQAVPAEKDATSTAAAKPDVQQSVEQAEGFIYAVEVKADQPVFDTTRIGRKPTIVCDDETEALDSVVAGSSDRTTSPLAETDAEPSIDRAARPSVVLTRFAAAESESASEASNRHTHLYGVRETARGVLFVQPASSGRTIAVAGQFNGWSATANPLRLNPQLMLHEAVVPIEAGTYEYRLVIDGKWQPDPYNARRRFDQYGEEHSIITVMRSPVAREGVVESADLCRMHGADPPTAMELQTTQAMP